MNVNKLFPRLTIRLKLTIAFALLSMVPLLAVAGLATRVTLRNVRTLTESTLRHDLDMARARTERALQEVEQDLAFVAGTVLGPRLMQDSETGAEPLESVATDFLALSPTLFRLLAVRADGEIIFATSSDLVDSLPRESSGARAAFLYSYLAASIEPGKRMALPVELRSGTDEAGPFVTTPAIAVLEPIRNEGGELVGVIVGEAYASRLFAGVDQGSPSLLATTGVVAGNGLLLHHSERKQDWTSLLASRSDANLEDDLSASGAAAVLSGEAGTLRIPDDRVVSYVPLRLAGSGIGPLTLYRVVRASALGASVRRLRTVALGGGAVLFLMVLGLAMLAARQFTGPIYTLRQGVRRLASGESDVGVDVETNDELEDLAHDFSAMAVLLSDHRNRLEELVEERTRALQEAHSKLADILEYSADAIVGLDLEGRVRLWNRGAESLFGYSVPEATGQRVDGLLTPESADSAVERAVIQREMKRHGAVVNLQTHRTPKDGPAFPVSLTQAPIRDSDGNPVGYSLIIRDTRTQARLEEQMRRSERLATVSVMAAGLAHELKNPLAIIGNRVEWMLRESNESCHECGLGQDLEVVSEHTSRLVDLTRDLLSFGREADDARGPVLLSDVCSRVAGLLDRTFAARQLTLETDLASDLQVLEGSEPEIETICMNLLMNAADATPSGGTVTMEVRRSQFGDSLELEVRDTGPGVPVELRRRIFEPFFTTKGKLGGTGLGLPLCRSIAERHGGTIAMESGEGYGSRFVVSFPLPAMADEWNGQGY
jgi:PAS domain S-box-containing protein